ncbi:MAG: TVP38/TMEM64 family protein [Acidobacteria bacterium]|nr:TVP38/TMEM64 family protein [Acidobacteriota bacterium]
MIETLKNMAGGRQYTKLLFKVALVVALVVVRYAFVHGYISEAGIQQFVRQTGVLAVPGFILLAALTVVVFGPPVLMVGSGVLAFGPIWGPVYSLVGITLGSCAAFLLGRYAMKDFARRQKRGRLQKIDDWIKLNGLAFTIGLRLFLFANPPLSYAASLTAVTFRDYTLGTIIGLLPGVVVLSFAFDELAHNASLSFLDMFVHPALISMWLLRVFGLVMLVALTKWYNRGKLAEQTYLTGD